MELKSKQLKKSRNRRLWDRDRRPEVEKLKKEEIMITETSKKS